MSYQRVILLLLVTGLATAVRAQETSVIATSKPQAWLEKAIDQESILGKYDYIDQNHKVPSHLLRKAILAYDAKKDQLRNPDVVSVIDYGARSDRSRFFIINMKTGEVNALHVAHGKGSDPDYDGYAQKFSNVPDSYMTSLGFYITGETYFGEHGRSLRLDGISASNSNARARDIVIHGAEYVSDSQRIQGRSFGCPAVSPQKINKVIDSIGGGSLILAGVNKE